MDYVAYSLLFAFIACVLTSFMIPIDQVAEHLPWVDSSQITGSTWLIIFINMIEFGPLLFIIGMQIICTIAEEYRIFQWIAVKSLHITKGNHRKFFYMICTIATLTAAVIADVTVAVIFVPLVIRACRILQIRSAPYLYGITITINIGSILTPFSSSKNILISSEFGLSFSWFMQNMGLFIIFALISTLVLLDFMVLRKYDPPEETRKQIFLDIMNPKLLISNRKRFIFNAVYVALIILGFMIFHEYSPLIAFFGAILMSILNRIPVTDILNKAPNPDATPFAFREFLVASALLHGDGYAEIERSNAGVPIALHSLHSLAVKPKRDGSERLYYEVRGGDGTARDLHPSRIFHFASTMPGQEGRGRWPPIAGARHRSDPPFVLRHTWVG